MKAAAFPVLKTIEEFDVAASSIPQATFDYLASLEWIRAAENYCAVGPAGTGKSHSLVAFGVAAVQAGSKVRYFTAADLAETLYRGLADNSVGRVIENLLRNNLVIIDEVGFAPLDDTGAQLLFRFVAAAYERRALGIGSHWPFDQGAGPARAHHRRQPARPAPASCRRRGHRRRVVPDAPGPDQDRRTPHQELKITEGWGLLPGHQRRHAWPLTHAMAAPTKPPCWPDDPDYLDGYTKIDLPSEKLLRLYWDVDILDPEKGSYSAWVAGGG